MPRFHAPQAILLLIVMLLLLPLQGHARMVVINATKPCAMEQHGMHGVDAVAPDRVPCERGNPCSADCQACAGCFHCPAGITLGIAAPTSRFVPPVYTAHAGPDYSSIPLYKDHPPPRNG